MTQEAFKAWWYNEGSQAPYTHHDCEEHTMRMCEIAWANGAYKALAEHAMQEVQRLGQEIEPDDIASILACRDMLDAQPVPEVDRVIWPEHTEQEPVQFKCTVIDDVHPNGIPLEQWTPPPQRTWVGLTDEEIDALHTSIKVRLMGTFDTKDIYRVVEQALKEKNT